VPNQRFPSNDATHFGCVSNPEPSAESDGERQVFGGDGNAVVVVGGADVGIAEDGGHVRLGGLLQREDGRRLEANVVAELRGDLANQALERHALRKKLVALLVTTNLSQSDGAGAKAVGLLGGGLLLDGVGEVLQHRKALTRQRLSPRRLARGLFDSHPRKKR